MTHLIDGDDLAVIVEPVGLGAKDLHLRWGWREVGRIGGQHSIRLGSILDLCHLVLVIARGRRRRRMDRSPDAGLSRARFVDARHGRGPRRREVNAPSVVSPFPFGAKGSLGVSPWSHGGGRWAGASLPPRAWQPRPPPVGRDGWIAGVNVSDGSCTRLRSGTSCEGTAGTAGGPGTRGSPAERGIHEFYRLPKFARGDGVSRKRAVGGTHRSVDAESDAGLLLGLGGELPAVEKAGNVGSEVSSRRSDRTGQRLERPIGISLPLALEKNRASTSSCVAEHAPGGTRDDAPGDRSAGSEGRGGTGEGGHDCLLGGYRNVRCRVLKTSALSAMLGLLLPRQTARSAVETL